MTREGRRDHPHTTYRDVFAVTSWWPWVASVTGTRIPIAMAPLALVYVGEAASGSYALGALMAGAFSITEALCSPMGGRLLGRALDMRRGLVVVLGIGATLMIALAAVAWAAPSELALVALSAGCGGVPAAAQGGLRAMLRRLVPARLQEKAFALDAVLLEVQWAAAPAIVALCVSLDAPTATVLVMAAAALTSAALIRTLPAEVCLRPPAAPAPTRTATAVAAWRSRSARGTYITSLLLGYAEGTVVVALPALVVSIGAESSLAAVILVGLSLSSAAGGLFYGWMTSRLGATSPARGSAVLLALGLSMLPVALGASLWVIALGVLVFGFFVAPLNAIRSLLLGRLLPQDQHTEGYSVLYGVNVLGTGLSALVSAALLNIADARVPMLTAAAITVVAGTLALVHRATQPRVA